MTQLRWIKVKRQFIAKSQVARFLDAHDLLSTEAGFLIYVDEDLQTQKVAAFDISAMPPLSKLLREGLRVGAAGIILVMNYPNGAEWPQRDHVKTFELLHRLTAGTAVDAIDLVIIARGEASCHSGGPSKR